MAMLLYVLEVLCALCIEASTLNSDGHGPGPVCLLANKASFLKRESLEDDTLPSFDSFIANHGRSYSVGTTEYAHRRGLYEQRVQAVRRQNAQSTRLWTAGVNSFSDRTEAELAALNGWRGSVKRMHLRQTASSHEQKILPTPDEKHYMNLNAAQLSVSQGGCGSCWAIAAVVTLQAGAEVNGINRTYSAQELVSCVPNPRHCGGEGGCMGATVELAMEYMMSHGLRTEDELPYVARDEICPEANTVASPTHLVSWETLPSNQYQPLLQAVAHHGPVAVSVSASGWFGYDSGIFDECSKDCVINHAVTLMGYGREATRKYWLIKNSWGETWGENSFIRLLRQDDDDVNQCGIDHQPQDGTGCDGGPAQVQVCGMCGILYDTVLPHFS